MPSYRGCSRGSTIIFIGLSRILVGLIMLIAFEMAKDPREWDGLPGDFVAGELAMSAGCVSRWLNSRHSPCVVSTDRGESSMPFHPVGVNAVEMGTSHRHPAPAVHHTRRPRQV